MSLQIALDTSSYVEFCKGDPLVLEQVQTARKIFIPFIVLGELRAGFLCGVRQENNSKILTRFLNSARTEILFADEQTTHHYARLFSYLKDKGKPIPTNDLWIAALVVQHDLILSTKDKHFKNLPQLPLI